ncbi:serpin family protein [Sphingosinicella sp. BN140058]|uniref:serpin family protein n=1 Tax=Sphingosinicella sp. BN140058 TaxID=1892855 RepID=UPI001FB15623|nr:serpin family protein [Sphingosinicella sp. BN140058]
MVIGAALLAAGAAASAQEPDLGVVEEVDRPVAAVLGPEGEAAIDGLNAFSLDFYKASARGDGNLFLSPASVSTAIGLAYRGAARATADEIRKVLHYPLPPAAFAAVNGEVLRTMKIDAPGRTLAVANRLWIQNGLRLSDRYVADMESHYSAGLARADFEGDAEAARTEINRWVEQQTGDRIRKLIPQGAVSAGTKAVLVNTIYLKAQWASQFSKAETREGPFKLVDGAIRQVPLMHQRAAFRITSCEGAQLASLPFRAGELEMLVLLPSSPAGLARVEKRLGSDTLAACLDKLGEASARDTILTLPRFRLGWKGVLNPALEELGLKVALSSEADFSAMKVVDANSAETNDHPVTLGTILHQTFLDVDELGSEAAAATAVVGIVVTGTNRKPLPPVVFRADHPFVLLVRDTRTGAILFIGRYAGPPPG